MGVLSSLLLGRNAETTNLLAEADSSGARPATSPTTNKKKELRVKIFLLAHPNLVVSFFGNTPHHRVPVAGECSKEGVSDDGGHTDVQT